eukprot:CAMPEP_0201534452 /NCGR_PEP_ID=MMETSP0161_2-20130828/56297_1 /ASSEMBLY_ACC=CAM_ASM_000251 /TAXON_ID=180227 /ORGANISM="Neoparamoeba aestuarina, Strain SoJaBio B1-5/56/2" /LENGTH=35 /DNA_ID= /DNA_START= /DNA_END= /DNA_ORIENTATION=
MRDSIFGGSVERSGVPPMFKDVKDIRAALRGKYRV